MKHTPGPWQIRGSHIYTADPDRAIIAQIYNPGSKSGDYPLEANGRLIAAAPDLLEACKRALLFVPEGKISWEIKAAIQKAEGQ